MDRVTAQDNFTVADLAAALEMVGAGDAAWRAAERMVNDLYRDGAIATCSLTRWKAV